MNEMEAIKILEKRMNRYHPADAITTATELAVVALREQAEREKGCPCCVGRMAATNVHDLYCAFCGKQLPRKDETK